MNPVLEYIDNSAEMYRKNQELEEQRKAQDELKRERLKMGLKEWFLSEVSQLVERIGYETHPVYKGRGIGLFRDFTTYVKDWRTWMKSGGGYGPLNSGPCWQCFYYEFQGRLTSSNESFVGGIYLPEWNISIRDELIGDVNDCQFLKDELGASKDGQLAHTGMFRFRPELLSSGKNKRRLRNILKRYKYY